ncbi:MULTISPECIES: type I pantothenate kinase [unclassified Motilimonas]|uniref:type I pantothenate kinase n=1 Tax=Motilimonas TaxID=1914248 RepID=UPI001E284543|nr:MULTISPECIES: type I pantothenate kinase [unclassified Motilimonas]MCE0557256.1 type I pantothenate kinase [Motilimonas sp. E26]MDO6526147.1 type I pantothenate kinase [Motilimonas sp. 1_MG-2023]
MPILDNKDLVHSAYLEFTRQSWAELRDNVPLTLSEQDLAKLKGINEDISLQEVVDIYLPLSRLLNLYVEARQKRSTVQGQFLGVTDFHVPYIIGIAGSVAVGKSTTARILQALLSCWSDHPKVALVTTDGFLHSNQELEQRGLMAKKGFPASYDIRSLVKFVSDIKSGQPKVTAPVYSHLQYDIVPGEYQVVEQPDILILEGLNVLQSGMDYPDQLHRVFVSDFVDFSLFVHAEQKQLKDWYIQRFLKFRSGAFTDPNAYFHHYSNLSESEASKTASRIWDEINGVNLVENISPTRERANLILTKGEGHQVEKIWLRK